MMNEADPKSPPTDAEAKAFKRLYGIVTQLRGEGGCPWDREQTPFSLRGDLVEETYECIEAIEEGEPDHIREELGDIFLLVTMIAYMHEQEGLFSVSEVLEGLSEKLIRRHPHVFGEASAGKAVVDAAKALSPEEALRNWARIKVHLEGRKPKDSILDEVSRGLPPLDRAWKLQKKAAKAGFDWPDAAGVIEKVREEIKEVEEVMRISNDIEKAENAALEEELGDLLFSAVNLCRFFDIEPSLAIQRTNSKFTERFKYVEKRIKENGMEMSAQSLAVMDKYWNEAKKAEN
jgi:tetrapyrrole methylase family protein/MazG family protein